MLAITLLASGCSARISDGTTSLGGDDASPGAVCASRTVFLNFDGQALVRGRSDATQNRAEWLLNDTGTAPPYHQGDPGRAALIQDIVDDVRAQLSMFPISVVVDRPASGAYVMVVLGGQRGQVGSRFGSAVNRLDCDDSRPNDVAWISDAVAPAQHVANLVVGAVGFGLGLTGTRDPRDCMCGWANDCMSNDTVACTLGTAIARDPAASQTCNGAGATQDEVATLRRAFCGDR